MVLKAPWFSKLFGSQNSLVLKTPWFSKLASLHVESKTTILYSKRYVVFFSENCTSVHSDSWRVETPCTVRWERERKRDNSEPSKVAFFSLFLTRFAKQRSVYIRVWHIFLDFKVSRYIEGYSFWSIWGPKV